MKKIRDPLSVAFLKVIPKTMGTIRSELRRLAPEQLTLPQFRVMGLLAERSHTNGDLAEKVGISVPSMSRIVDGLVRRGYLERQPSAGDRRQVLLRLSARGRRTFDTTLKSAEDCFAARFKRLSAPRRTSLASGLKVLSERFSEGAES